jgi:hypothetical protein
MAPRERLIAANGHAADLTPAALQARIDQTHATLKALLAERPGIALASVAGDTAALRLDSLGTPGRWRPGRFFDAPLACLEPSGSPTSSTPSAIIATP